MSTERKKGRRQKSWIARLGNKAIIPLVFLTAGTIGVYLYNQDTKSPSLAQKLNDYDQLLSRNTVPVDTIIGQIFYDTSRIFCQEASCNPNDFTLVILNNEEFMSQHRQMVGCKTEQLDTSVAGYPDINDKKIYFKRVYATIYPSGKKLEKPAETIALMLLHEQGHANTTEKVPQNSDLLSIGNPKTQRAVDRYKGFLAVIFDPTDNLPGSLCRNYYRGAVEEAWVETNAEQLLRNNGVELPAKFFPSLVLSFNQNILPVFNNDYRKLLILHAGSDYQGFRRELALKKGFSGDLQQQSEEFLLARLGSITSDH